MDDAVDAMMSHWQALQLSKADDQERDAADAEEDAGDGEDGEAESSGEEEEGEVKGARAGELLLILPVGCVKYRTAMRERITAHDPFPLPYNPS